MQPHPPPQLLIKTQQNSKLFLGDMDQFDFSYLNKAFKRALEPKLPSTDIRPIPDERCVNTAHLGEAEKERLEQIGKKQNKQRYVIPLGGEGLLFQKKKNYFFGNCTKIYVFLVHKC